MLRFYPDAQPLKPGQFRNAPADSSDEAFGDVIQSILPEGWTVETYQTEEADEWSNRVMISRHVTITSPNGSRVLRYERYEIEEAYADALMWTLNVCNHWLCPARPLDYPDVAWLILRGEWTGPHIAKKPGHKFFF